MKHTSVIMWEREISQYGAANAMDNIVSSPLSAGGPKNFEVFLKRVGLALFYFLGAGGDGIFQEGPEDFQLSFKYFIL